MTPRELCQPGEKEPLKAAVHGALGLLAGVCFAYNLAALVYRRKAHLARNAVVYGAIVGLEVAQVRRHLHPR